MKDDLDSEANKLMIDLSEAVLDQFIGNPLIKDIPLLGTAVSIARIGKTISDRIFLSKVKIFLESIKDDRIDREAFSDHLKTDENQKKKTQEIVVLLISRSDSLDKVKILGKVFQKLLEHEISFEMFHRIGFAIDLAFIDDLNKFIRIELPMTETDDSLLLLSLVPTGLTVMSNRVRNTYGSIHTNPISISNTGLCLIKIINESN